MLISVLIVGLLLVAILVLASVCLWAACRGQKRSKRNKCSSKRCCGKEVVAKCSFPVGVTPAGVALSCDGSVGYVANNNNYGITGSDSVTVLNVECCTVTTTILDGSFNEPYTVTLSPDGALLYVTNSAGTSVTIVDTETNTVVGTIDGFDGPSGLVILSNAPSVAYVNNYGSAFGVGSGNGTTVSLVDLTTQTIIGTIVVGMAPAALAASPDGSFVYVINYVDGMPGTGTMSVIRTNDNAVVATVAGFSGPFGIAVTKDGKKAYVTNFGSNNFAPYGTTVSVVDLIDLTISKEVSVGIQPSGVAIGGHFAYVTNYNTLYAGPSFTDLTAGQGTVSIIDTRTDRVVPKTILVGQSPANIAIKRDTALVSAYTANIATALALEK